MRVLLCSSCGGALKTGAAELHPPAVPLGTHLCAPLLLASTMLCSCQCYGTCSGCWTSWPLESAASSRWPHQAASLWSRWGVQGAGLGQADGVEKVGLVHLLVHLLVLGCR